MDLKTITLTNGEQFNVRLITIFKGSSEECDVLIAGTDLSCVLMHDDGEIPQWEREELDERIVFFVEPEELLLWGDDELVEYIEKQLS